MRTVPVTVSPSFRAARRSATQAAGLLFQNHAPVHHYILVGGVELDNAAVNLLPDECFECGRIVRAAARSRHEGAHAHVHAQAALDDGGHRAGHGHLVCKGRLQGRPVPRLRHAEARELVIALFIASRDGNREDVAWLDVYGIVFKSGARQNAFGFVADVEENLIGGKGDHFPLQLLGVGLPGVAAIVSRERVGKGLLRLNGRRGRLLGGGLGGNLASGRVSDLASQFLRRRLGGARFNRRAGGLAGLFRCGSGNGNALAGGFRNDYGFGSGFRSVLRRKFGGGLGRVQGFRILLVGHSE